MEISLGTKHTQTPDCVNWRPAGDSPSAPLPSVECKHEPYYGKCVHCNVIFVGGRPVPETSRTAPKPRRKCSTCQSDDPKYELFFVYGEPEPRKGLWNQCQDSFHRGVAAPEGETRPTTGRWAKTDAIVSPRLGAYLNTMVAELDLIHLQCGQYLWNLFSEYEAELAAERTDPQGTGTPCTCCNDLAQAAQEYAESMRVDNTSEATKHQERAFEILAKHITAHDEKSLGDS